MFPLFIASTAIGTILLSIKFAQNMFGGARVGNVLVVGVLYLNVGGGVGNVHHPAGKRQLYQR